MRMMRMTRVDADQVAALMGEVCGDKDVTYVRVAHYVHTICMQHRLW